MINNDKLIPYVKILEFTSFYILYMLSRRRRFRYSIFLNFFLQTFYVLGRDNTDVNEWP